MIVEIPDEYVDPWLGMNHASVEDYERGRPIRC